jgi:transcriptional regulator
MYTPSHFSETDSERIATWIGQYSFATLISSGPNGLLVTHAPLLFDRDRGTQGMLSGHIARANPHAKQLVDAANLLAIFHGPHCYISPTWYVDANPQDPNVPGWNYVTVHAHGKVRRIDDEERKWQIVRQLSAHHERGSAQPWVSGESFEHTPKLGALVGFEVAINRIEAKSKLSQNRSTADQKRVIENLEAGTHPDSLAIARFMRENIGRRSLGDQP